MTSSAGCDMRASDYCSVSLARNDSISLIAPNKMCNYEEANFAKKASTKPTLPG